MTYVALGLLFVNALTVACFYAISERRDDRHQAERQRLLEMRLHNTEVGFMPPVPATPSEPQESDDFERVGSIGFDPPEQEG